jgi:diguanylate cyclase
MKIRIEGTFLRSAVGRRVFLLFVLSAFVPAALLAALSYSHVRSLVNDYAQRQLVQDGKAQGRALYDRLLGAHFLLTSSAALTRTEHALADSNQFAWHRVFRRSRLVINNTAVAHFASSDTEPSLQLTASEAAHLAKGEVALLLPPAAGASLPWLAVAIDAAQPARGILMAELQPEYLWGDQKELSYQTNICVFGSGTVPLYCSSPELGANAAGTAMRAADGVAVRAEGWLGTASGLFLRAKFGAPDWTVVALRPLAEVATPLAAVTYLFLEVTLLALLLVALLSVIQIRRTLVPLERLIEGTERIAREEFGQPVRVERKDEFGQLATSLNHMANRLGSQIGAMRALSAIDQEILSHLDIQQIIARVHARLLEILPQAVISVIVPDQNQAQTGIVYLKRSADIQMTRVQLPWEEQDIATLASGCDAGWLDPMQPGMPSCIAMQRDFGARHCFMLPIFWRSQIDAMLVIGTTEPQQFSHGLIAQIRDLGNRVGVALAAQAREARLTFLGHHDDLTSLPNRALLRHRLQQQMAQARHDSKHFGLLFLNLDRFKIINDNLGHESGDQLLRLVGERLRESVRQGDTVARLGGDEFVVLLADLDNSQQAANVAAKVLRMLSPLFDLGGNECFITASIGIAMFPADGMTPEELLKRADIAMYRAKAVRPGGFVFFEESMNVEQRERAFMEQELRLAIARQQFFVQYQPRVTLEDGRFVGAEALLRWQHPELGLVSPALFIPLAEEIGLIDEIGPWVMQHVCQQIASWQAAGQVTGTVAVNVSGREFKSNNLVAQVRRILAAHSVAAHVLELEVTEGVLIDDFESVIDVLGQLAEIGVSIALDDFGTGYSSMAYLSRLPINVLKIDQSFVRDLVHDEGARSIVQAIIALAHALHKSVVAEGVETQQQAELLRALGCDEAQGYYFSRPVAPAALEALMLQRVLPAAPASSTASA